MSASSMPQNGPGPIPANSMTLMPASGPDLRCSVVVMVMKKALKKLSTAVWHEPGFYGLPLAQPRGMMTAQRRTTYEEQD
jgi:hypothetical protein